jgi:hypothetical protein
MEKIIKKQGMEERTRDSYRERETKQETDKERMIAKYLVLEKKKVI